MALWTNAHVIARPPSNGKCPRMKKFRADSVSVLRKYHTHAYAVMP